VTTWGQGDYPAMAETLVDVARATVRWADLHTGDRVIDLATGTGAAALIAAADGSDVIGVDTEPVLLDLARRRAARAGLTVAWRLADVTATGVEPGWADALLSVFGVIYADDPDAALSEMARLTRPPARLVMAAWPPGSFLPSIGRAVGPFLPPPTGSAPPSRWGDRAWLDIALPRTGFAVEEHREQLVTWGFRDSDAATQFFIDTAGHVVAERARLETAGQWEDLRDAVHAVVDGAARRDDGAIAIESPCLLTRAVRV
jgi:ubiquinone/menaquinone biosynthesis C-methylase UbiE